MEFSEADRILSAYGATRTQIAAAPPPSAEVDCFSLPRERAVCLAHDEVNGKRRISDIELIEDMDKPKSQRRSQKVREIDLSVR